MTINSIMYNIVISSGDIAFRFLDYVKSRSDSHTSESLATVCDINKSMLEVGKKRAARLRYETGEKHEMFERSNFNSGYVRNDPTIWLQRPSAFRDLFISLGLR